MESSEQTVTATIGSFIDGLKKENPLQEAAVILVGSVARNAATANSDLDLLVIADRVQITRVADRLHIQVLTEAEMLRRLEAGDDFAAWCVRFGIPIVDSGAWNRIVSAPEAASWPDWRQKTVHAARRLVLASDLSKSGDQPAATEELLYATSHVGRAVLLKSQVFPLSRPEMITQLKEAGYPHISMILAELSFGQITEQGIRQAIAYVKKLLVHLDRAGFEAYSQSRLTARQRKSVPATTVS